MEPTDNIEKAVLADIDGLRKQFPNTQDLYREVCILMFFRYGMTPTANKLYQLVRKGSMSAPSEALSRFWDNLRDKSRVTIEHPDLPDALKVAAGGLVATLWRSAQDIANEQFSTFKDEAQSKLRAAEDATVAAKADRDHALAELSATQDRLGQANKQIDQLSHEVTSLGSTNVSIEGQLQNARADLLDSQARLDACRTDFAAELEKIRLAARQNEERIAGTEARALVEIDRERVNAAQSRKALEKALAERAAAEGRNRDEMLIIQKQLAIQNHKNGIQEGELRAMTVNLDKSLAELDRLREQLNEAGARNSMLRAERKALEVTRTRPRKASRKLDSTTAEVPTQNTAKRSVRAK
jgi:chromosome segregation ATPase